MQHEIWFRKWLWSYVPVHWKGLALMFGAIISVFVCFGVLVIAAQLLETPAIAFTIPVPFLYILITTFRIARKHSA